jgi:membrane-associated phospholipid phosphatase
MTMQFLDAQLLLLINHSAANALFDVLMPTLSSQGYLLILPFLLFMILRGISRKDTRGKSYLFAAIGAIVIACCSAYLAGGVEDWMKDAVARVRPCRAIESIRLIVPCPKSYSMPSGHAISSFSFAVPLFYLSRDYLARPWRLYPIVLAAMIAFSRLYLGVHYPTDVLAGVLLGTSIAMGLSRGYELILRKKRTKMTAV